MNISSNIKVVLVTLFFSMSLLSARSVAIFVNIRGTSSDMDNSYGKADPEMTIGALQLKVAERTGIPIYEQQITVSNYSKGIDCGNSPIISISPSKAADVKVDDYKYCATSEDYGCLFFEVIDLRASKSRVAVMHGKSVIELSIFNGANLYRKMIVPDTVADVRQRLVWKLKELNASEEEIKEAESCTLYDADTRNTGKTFSQPFTENMAGATRLLLSRKPADADTSAIEQVLASIPVTVTIQIGSHRIRETISGVIPAQTSREDLKKTIAEKTGIPVYCQQIAFLRKNGGHFSYSAQDDASVKLHESKETLLEGDKMTVEVADLRKKLRYSTHKPLSVMVELPHGHKVRIPLWQGEVDQLFGDVLKFNVSGNPAIDAGAAFKQRFVQLLKYDMSLPLTAEERAQAENCTLYGADPENDATFGQRCVDETVLADTQRLTTPRLSFQKYEQTDRARIKQVVQLERDGEALLQDIADQKIMVPGKEAVVTLDEASTTKALATLDSLISTWASITKLHNVREHLPLQDQKVYDDALERLQIHLKTLSDTLQLPARADDREVIKAHFVHTAHHAPRLALLLSGSTGEERTIAVQRANAIKTVLFAGGPVSEDFDRALEAANKSAPQRIALNFESGRPAGAGAGQEDKASLLRRSAPYAVAASVAVVASGYLARNTELGKKLRYRLFGLTNSLLKEEAKQLRALKTKHLDEDEYQRNADRILNKYRPKDQEKIKDVIASELSDSAQRKDK